MYDALTEKHKKYHRDFIDFTKAHVEPFANSWDIEQCISQKTIQLSAEMGYLGGTIPKEYNGQQWDWVTYGLFNEAVGYASISFSGLFNVHTMICQTILKWGTQEQKSQWLPLLATGKKIAALALTEPNAGSDLQGMETLYEDLGDTLLLQGQKKWITCGAIADVILVFGKLKGSPVACLVEKDTPGMKVTSIREMLGFRAAHLALLEFDNCKISKANMIGKPGAALMYIAPYALEFGRISVAWACLGLLRACFERCSSHVQNRKSFGHRLIEHGMIQTLLTDMGVELQAAYLLCLDACQAKDRHDCSATEDILAAKYFASRVAARHAANAVQIMGALGCNENFSVSRFYRDAKTMEIIEGSNQIIQTLLGKSFAIKGKKNFMRNSVHGK